MNSIQINNLLYNCGSTKQIFKGVFACDTLPDTPKRQQRPAAFVVNTDEISRPGQHWIAIFFPRKGSPEYFDSYGLPPLKSSLEHFINTSQYIFNNKQLQSFFTTVCGQYVIYFIWQKCLGKTIKDIQSIFYNNLLQNDSIVNEIIEKHFNTDLDIIDIPFLKKQISKSFYGPKYNGIY